MIVMTRVLFVLLIANIACLLIEVNNIQNGYRSIYHGTPSLSTPYLALAPYSPIKEDLSPSDFPFLTLSLHQASLSLLDLVRQFELEEIDPQQPVLTYRYFHQPSIVVTLSGEEPDEALLEEVVSLGRAAEELEL